MPGASGWPLSASGSSGGASSARPSTRSMSLRAAGRRGAAASAPRSSRRWSIRRRPRPARRRRSGRFARRDRLAHAAPWSARHGPTGWPMAPPPARRRRAGWRARPGGREPGSRWCRARRWRARRPRNPPICGSTSVSGPGQNASASSVAVGIELGDPPGGGEIADMGDQRIERRPALGLIKPGDRGRRWWRPRRGRRRSRSGTRPARPRPRQRPAAATAPRRRAKSAFSGLNSQG